MAVERSPLKYSGIFFDSPNLELFDKWFKTGILGGATLNPPSLKKEGVYNVQEHFEKMIEVVSSEPFPISVEIPDTNWPAISMITLGVKYHKKFPHHAVIKVPMDYEDPWKSLVVIKALGKEGVRTNATLGITSGQLMSAAEASRYSQADGDNYISLFWGRREEVRKELIDKELSKITEESGKENYYEDNYKETIKNRVRKELIADAPVTLKTTLKYLETHGLNTRIIVGSIRRPYQIEQAFGLGADIVTVPPEILSEWMRTKRGEETTEEFNQAFRSVQNEVTLMEGFSIPK